MNKQKSKKKSQVILASCLALAMIITGAFAFLTATDTKTNVFTVGSVKMQLIENFDINQDGSINDPDAAGYDATLPTEVFSGVNEMPEIEGFIVPENDIIKQPYIKNTGSNDAYVYMAVGIPVATASEVAGDTEDSITNGDTQPKIVVKGFAVQDYYDVAAGETTTAASTWEKYVTGKKADIFGESVIVDADADRIELFNFYKANAADTDVNTVNDGWSLVEADPYTTADYTYYIYAYDYSAGASQTGAGAILPANTSTQYLFDTVRLIGDVGGEYVAPTGGEEIAP